MNNFKEPLKKIVKQTPIKPIKPIVKEKPKSKETYLEIYGTYLGLILNQIIYRKSKSIILYITFVSTLWCN